MSTKAEELAKKLADMTSKHKAPSHERGVLNGAVEELRRLAQVEAEHEALKKAISDAVPVAVIGSTFQLLWSRQDWSDGLKVGDFLYTLEGIRTKP